MTNMFNRNAWCHSYNVVAVHGFISHNLKKSKQTRRKIEILSKEQKKQGTATEQKWHASKISGFQDFRNFWMSRIHLNLKFFLQISCAF